MSAGSNSQLATARMTAFGVTSIYVSAASFDNWRWTNFVSEGLEHKIEELMEQSIYGYADEPPSHRGLETAEGDVEFEPNPNAFGQFIRGNFGVCSTTVLCDPGSTGANSGDFAGGGAYQHVFTPRQSPFDPKCFLDPYQVLIYRDVGSAWVFQDTVFPKLEVSIQAGQLTKATVGFMARKIAQADRSAVASLVTSGGRPFVWDMASFQIGAQSGSLSATDYFEACNVNLETPIEGVPLLDGTRFYGEMQKSDFRKTRFSGTLSFRDQTEYQAFKAYEDRYLRITFTNVNTQLLMGNPNSAFYQQLQFDIPKFKITQFGAMVKNPNRITADFEGRGTYSTQFGFAIQARLRNTVNSY